MKKSISDLDGFKDSLIFFTLAFSYITNEAGFYTTAFLSSVVVSLFVLLSTKNGNIYQIMWGIGFSIFFASPFIIGYFTGELVNIVFYNCLLMLSVLYIKTMKNIKFFFPRQNASANYLKYYMIIAMSCIGVALTNGDGFIFFASLTLLFMFRNLVDGGLVDFKKIMIPYILFYFFYSIFFWSGFGRLILAGFIIVPVLAFVEIGNYKVKNYYYYFGSIIVSLLMTALRFKDGVSLQNIKNDSAIGPYFLSQSIFEDKVNYSFDLFGMLDQFLLMFFSFVPRFLWSDKPIGFGRLYVDQQMDTSIYSDMHSIAGLYTGEIIYYTTDYWFLFSAIAITVYCLLFAVLNKINKSNDNFSFIGVIFIPTFMWGGFASFGARFSSVLVFIFGWILLEKIIKKSIG